MAQILAEKDFRVYLKEVKMTGYNGEFNLYRVEEGKETIIFSNDDSFEGAVIGDKITFKTASKIANKLF